MNTVSDSTLQEAERAWNFYDWAQKGNPDEYEGDINKAKEWEFEFTENELEIAGIYDDYDLRIIVERKDTEDGTVEVINYETKTILNRIDVTEKIKKPEVDLVGNKLLFSNLGLNKIEMIKFNEEFILAQLGAEKIGQDRRDFRDTVIGWQVIYIRIPKDVEVIAKQPYVDFVVAE